MGPCFVFCSHYSSNRKEAAWVRSNRQTEPTAGVCYFSIPAPWCPGHAHGILKPQSRTPLFSSTRCTDQLAAWLSGKWPRPYKTKWSNDVNYWHCNCSRTREQCVLLCQSQRGLATHLVVFEVMRKKRLRQLMSTDVKAGIQWGCWRWVSVRFFLGGDADNVLLMLFGSPPYPYCFQQLEREIFSPRIPGGMQWNCLFPVL